MAGILTAAVASTFGANADPYFEYTTLLLPGNGTNGAQNNTFLDGSTNNFTITRNGNTTQGTFSPFSQTGWGNYFDGSSSINVATATTFAAANEDFTIECWVYRTSIANQMICGWNNNPTFDYFYLPSNGSISLNANNTYTIDSGILSWQTNNWYHIAISRVSGVVKIFRDGNQVGSNISNSNSFGTTANIRIADWFAGSPRYYFSGYISNFRFVKGIGVYTGNFNVPTSPLGLTQSAGTNIQAITGSQTKLLTCQNNRFIDISGNATSVTVQAGSPSVVAFSPFNPTASWSAATYGGSGYFDGSGDYLTAPASNITDFATGQAYTFECWFYTTSTSTQSLFKGDANGFFCDFSSSFIGFGKAGVIYIVNASTTITTNQWYHVAISRNTSNQSRIWLNGNSLGSNSSDTYAFNNVTNYIGREPSTINPMFGYMSNIRVVKGTAVYDPTQTSITVPTAPLTAITNTSLLLNFTNAGIYDATSKNDLETVGDAQISNTTAKWGSTSIKFDGTGDYLSIPNVIQLRLGASDFTIEFWANTTSFGAQQYTPIVGIWDVNAPTSTIASYYVAINAFSTTYKLGFSYMSIGGATTDVAFGTTTNSTGTWDHYAVVRSGNLLYGFKNGTLLNSGGTAITVTIADGASTDFRIGGVKNGNVYNGYIQDLRITRGYARYTANFTAPTAAFPTL